ncbi:hypothetical protein NP493_786g01099 [Ridgeia piscesae]|uniref:Vesicle tethering protein Uso1/P115-like head domain-containing protein n=1 Tax=Ridgeia piscesae TaxID=27915 RepID=A0AAD9KPW1_RIDPI|nr:hypothetical protein NP493_786g01099 [Ridgeia piscesae]
MDLFRKYLGAQQGDQLPSGAETVERLCERVRTSTLLDDRRDAVRALKSLSKKFQLEVGTIAMDVLITVLENDRTDTEILGYVLETLCNTMCNEPLDEEDDNTTHNHLPENMGTQFTEMFIKNPDNVREIIRNDGLLLLLHLTRNSTNIQKIVAFENAFEGLLNIINEEGTSDGGIVVEDCLHLMLNLLKNNSSNQNFFKEGSYIQRLTPFFDLQSTPSEGWSAQKVTNIQLMLLLLRSLVSPGNPQQQTTDCQKVMYRCGLLEKLCHILMASGVPADVLTESINTVSEVIRGCSTNQEYFASVMAPSNPPRPELVVLLLSMVNDVVVVGLLLVVLLLSMVNDVVVVGCAGCTAAVNGRLLVVLLLSMVNDVVVVGCCWLYCCCQWPALVVLLLSMVNEKQPFMLRCAVLYLNTISAGQLLCGGLFSVDPLSTWFAAVALLHAVNGNTAQKEQLLRVQLATSLGNPPVSLLQQCANILAQGPRVLTRVGLLMLLCHWLADCPIAVTHFLHNSANVPFVSASEGDELELVVQALCAFLLGLCVLFNDDQVENCQSGESLYCPLTYFWRELSAVSLFTVLSVLLERTVSDKLSQVAKHENYNNAAKKPQVDFPESAEVVFDHQFTRLFKKLESDVQKVCCVCDFQKSEVDEQKKQAVIEQHDSIVSQYKELIREQDAQLNTVRAELSDMKGKYSNTDKTIEELTQQIQQLKDQNALLKAHRG